MLARWLVRQPHREDQPYTRPTLCSPFLWVSFRNSFSFLPRRPNTLAASFRRRWWVSPFCPSGFSRRRVPTVPSRPSKERTNWITSQSSASRYWSSGGGSEGQRLGKPPGGSRAPVGQLSLQNSLKHLIGWRGSGKKPHYYKNQQPGEEISANSQMRSLEASGTNVYNGDPK